MSGAELETRHPRAIGFERCGVAFVETVEPKIVVKQEARVVGEDTLNAAALKLKRFRGTILDPRFAQGKRRPHAEGGEVLIGGELVVQGAG